MSERDPLLAAIIAEPDDDTPRLVFADWLQESGDEERAEFIREQVQFARVPRSDPQWSALYGRSERKWRKAMDRWRRELPAFPGVGWGDFRRGFVEAASFSSAKAFARSGAQVLALQPVTEIELASRKNIGELARCAALPRVRALRFKSFSEPRAIDPAELGTLLRAPNGLRLRSLDLGGAFLPPEAAVTLAECPHLTALEELSVCDNHLGDTGLEALAASPHLTSLQDLNAHTNGVTNAGVERLAAAGWLGSLRHLHLGDVIGPPAARALALAPHLTNLAALILSRHEIGAEGMRWLAGSANFAGLERLTLAGRRNGTGLIGSGGARAIAQSPHLRNLRVLLLLTAGIGDAGTVALANSPNVTRLTTLNLIENGITDAGAFALVHSPYLTEMTADGLCLHGNGDVSDDAMQALSYRFGQLGGSSRASDVPF